MGFLRFVARFIFWLLALLGIAVVAHGGRRVLFSSIDLGRPDVKVPTRPCSPSTSARGWRRTMSELPFAPVGKPTIEDIVLGLEAAANDSRVKGVMLKVGRGPLNMAEAQEIRDAVAGFQNSSKPIHAFAESFGEGGDGTLHYYVAASADRIFLQPSGDVATDGLHAGAAVPARRARLAGRQAAGQQAQGIQGRALTCSPRPRCRRRCARTCSSWPIPG